MFLKVYQKYIINHFLFMVLKVSSVFLSLIIILSIFEEISFFSDIDVNVYFPVLLVLMNSPSILYEIFPFIFLITSQFFFIKFLDSNEFIAFKSYGLSNIKILSILSLTSLVSGIVIVTIFYNLSSMLKFKYIDLKNPYTNDNRYLASITENGLWIKDEGDDNTYFINADKISFNKIYNIDILVLDKNFNLHKTIFSEKANISNKKWLLDAVTITEESGNIIKMDNYTFSSNFDYNRINNLYSNLSSLTILDLIKLRRDYKQIKYSMTDIEIHIKKIYSYPFYLTIMTILSSIIMMNVKHQKPKIFYIVGGIIFSVLIYYLNFFFIALGKNEQIPVLLSVWLPMLLLTFISFMGMARLNEK